MSQTIINKGVDYLNHQQQKDGSFLSYSTSNRLKFKNARKHHSTFPPSLILLILCGLDETPQLKEVKKKAADFLLSQKSSHWSFNYWARNSKESKKMPYPDDLDDTFCALSALYQYNSKLIDGSAMAKIVTLLTAVEKKEGGPYRTWLVPDTAKNVWKDVDLAVNSNVAYFLSLQDVHLPNINSLVEQAITNNKLHSPYYPSVYPIIYFISRWYPSLPKTAKRQTNTKKLVKFLLSKRDSYDRWNNPLDTALSVSSLLNFGVPPGKIKRSIDYLIHKQQKKALKAYPFVTELVQKRKTTYAGSSALTTAFFLEAVAKYQRITDYESGAKNEKIKDQKDKIQKRIYKEVIGKAEQRFSELETDLKRLSLAQLKKIVKGDKDKQIVLMPYFFARTIGRRGNKLKHNFLVKLGLANLYGWIAYTIYDDFLDDEGKPELLSVANVCLRELTAIYTQKKINLQFPTSNDFVPFFQQVMDKLDAANTWEVTHCRNSAKIPDYKNYSKLAERSLGHALGPVAILFSLGYKASSPETKNLMKFFESYLIARQLNDDAHDWEEDLKRGQINAAGAAVLKKARQKKIPFKKTEKGMALFQEIFWYEIVVDICDEVINQVKKARGYLAKVSIIKNTSMFEKMLIKVEGAAQKALQEREETISFLKTYRK